MIVGPERKVKEPVESLETHSLAFFSKTAKLTWKKIPSFTRYFNLKRDGLRTFRIPAVNRILLVLMLPPSVNLN